MTPLRVLIEPLGRSSAQLALIASVSLCAIACEGREAGDQADARDNEPIATLVIASEVRIGGDTARGPAALGAVRTSRLLSGGTRVAVPELISREIRIFGVEGEYIETFGRRGRGPGEYENLSAVYGLPGGELVGWDDPPGVITIHGVSGPETIRVDLSSFSGRTPRFLGVFSDTTFVFGLWLSVRELRGELEGRIDTVPFVRVDRRGVVIDTLALVEDVEKEYFDVGPMWGLEKHIFGDELRAVVASDELIVILGRRVRHYPRSDPAREYEVDREPRIPTSDEILAERSRRIGEVRTTTMRVSSGENIGELHGAVIEGLPVADTVPAFDDLAAGYDGSIWVRQFTMPADTAADWYLLDGRGGISATLRLPLDERLESGTRERVVVRGRDTLGSVLLRVLTLTQLN